MKKKNKIIVFSIVALLVIINDGLVMFLYKKNKSATSEQIKMQENIQDNKKIDNEKNPGYFYKNEEVDTSNWKVHETEYFIIKFPKDWHWLEISSNENNAHSNHVISNNIHFDFKKYDEINAFSDIGPSPSVILKSKSDVVISDTVIATSNAGTPKDSINTRISLAKKNNETSTCTRPTVFQGKYLIALCAAFFEKERQLKNVYYIANEENTVILSFNTTKDTLINKKIFNEIAKSIELK